MSDLIDRKEAIDALERSKKIYFDRQVIIGAMKDIVRNLPSAQPEIIRCKDCKHWRFDHTCREHSLVSPMMANEFCSRAERRDVDDEKQIR